MTEPLRLALSSKGAYEEATMRFLERAGLSVWRPNPRQYVGRISGLPNVEVLFQRTEDIVHKVVDGSADLGITGYDLVAEHGGDAPNLHVVIEDLGFRRCELVLAVPEGWLDITTVADLADLSVDLRRTGRTLRVATKFPNLTRDFLYRHGVNYFSLVDAHGALEAAPTLGYADIIADLSETGVTLRDNRLRVLDGGVILRAQACLIASRRTLRDQPAKLEAARTIIELSEARLRTRQFRLITANVQGESAEAVAQHVISQMETAGEQGPTIADIYPKHGTVDGGPRWFGVTIIVPAHLLLPAVDHLRRAGSSGITVTSPDYVFDACSPAYERLLRSLEECR
ncbi:ATP phosphoribosyltransferase [Sphaerobacter thermophilus]|jgi:ATP phosphoribosyltransferase|uniref:ATP phosphoribosyltransferase n=1 Tax=Sphaerobacter thermophilus (strain ATCC 49802 / DSM 20745 / KCCM 41009 / NCIMB 13125 / S 6022) TaxID=479434 RepID=D1C4E2_SPHTD|nr:ATP phosphoribosyltransferase [Sphaerobacter thermophilus]ACZ39109.1 ATP phosphoribosyltransferase [Sphaerobacter thermophilus DSM 20745]PZN63646.1 MAG: ATP phosphoribosyltransferase [Sphaerobacter thermophilus]